MRFRRPSTRNFKKFEIEFCKRSFLRKRDFIVLENFSNSAKVIFADFTFITPSSRNWSGNDFYNTRFENLFFLRICGVKFRNFTISAKGHFRGFDFYKTKLNQKRGGADFYNTMYLKIMEITPITPKKLGVITSLPCI